MTRFPLKPAVDPRRERRSKRIKIALLCMSVILLITVAYFGINKLIRHFSQKDSTGYVVCEYTNAEAFAAVEVTEEGLIVNDYLFYGETLDFYQEPYQVLKVDNLVGYSITLKNLCNPELEYVFLIDELIDGQIALEILAEGFYEIYMTKDFVIYRIYADNPSYSEFFTLPRAGESKKIEVIADAELFANQDGEQNLENNYYFLKVTKDTEINQPTVLIYDDNRNNLDYSNIVAYSLQMALEQKSIQSIVVSTEEELWEAVIEGKANYFIGLTYSEQNGLSLSYSALASPRLVNALAYSIEEKSITVQALSPLDRENPISMILHGVGGKSTISGVEFNAPSLEERLNQVIFGKQGVYIEYSENWNSTYFAEQIAKALSNYLDISK